MPVLHHTIYIKVKIIHATGLVGIAYTDEYNKIGLMVP
jgi:hypothetical protein